MLEALPSHPSDSGVAEFEASLKSIDNNAVCPSSHSTLKRNSLTNGPTQPYQPLKAPYPIPQNYGFATKTTAQCDIVRLCAYLVIVRSVH